MRSCLCLAQLSVLSLGSWSLVATPAGADWLVTHDGSRVETDGEWRVEGRRVLFTLPNGTLSALRLSEVDVDASRAATEEAKNPPQEEAVEAAAEKEKPTPVLVLTDKDIPKASSETEASDQGAADSGPDAPALRVLEWNVQPGDGGLMLIGRVENGTSGLQSGIRLRVDVRNDEGEVLATASSTLTQDRLVAGGISVFRARFPGFDELPGEPSFVIDSAESRQAEDSAGEDG